MSKKVKKAVIKEKSIKEAIEKLQVQLKNYKIMTINAEGALEVLLQLQGNKKDE